MDSGAFCTRGQHPLASMWFQIAHKKKAIKAIIFWKVSVKAGYSDLKVFNFPRRGEDYSVDFCLRLLLYSTVSITICNSEMPIAMAARQGNHSLVE